MIAVGWAFIMLAVTGAVWLWIQARMEQQEDAERARNMSQLRARQIDTFCETNAARWNEQARQRDTEVERGEVR